MCLTLGSRALGKVENHIQPSFGGVGPAIEKFDSRGSINKETPCSTTQQIDVLVAWPPVKSTTLREFGKFVFEEKPYVIVD